MDELVQKAKFDLRSQYVRPELLRDICDAEPAQDTKLQTLAEAVYMAVYCTIPTTLPSSQNDLDDIRVWLGLAGTMESLDRGEGVGTVEDLMVLYCHDDREG